MIWEQVMTRRAFVDLVAGAPAEAVETGGVLAGPLPPGRMRAYWRRRPGPRLGEMPSLVVVPDAELAEILSWIRTYLPDRAPATSLIRVVPTGLLEQLGPGMPGKAQGHLASPEVAVSLVLAELVERAWHPGQRFDLTPRA